MPIIASNRDTAFRDPSDENNGFEGGRVSAVRLFDLRSLDHSTIIFETADYAPVMRLAWNKQAWPRWGVRRRRAVPPPVPGQSCLGGMGASFLPSADHRFRSSGPKLPRHHTGGRPGGDRHRRPATAAWMQCFPVA